MEIYKDKITVDILLKTLESKGYKTFTNGNYNLNIVGIRKDLIISNDFDDLMCIFYKVDGKWILKKYPITTDPGRYYTENLLNSKGVAILKPGQYLGSYKIGLHKGQYKALVQNKPLPVYRDNNKDHIIDYKVIDTGMFGINIHRSSATGNSKKVDKWSAGCQVFSDIGDYNEFIKIIDISAKNYGSIFTYTLLESKDIKY